MNLLKEQFTDNQELRFRKFIRSLPSCLSGSRQDVVCAHVRRVSEGAGTGYKPKLFAVPLTDKEHRYQHQHGELACIEKFLIPAIGLNELDARSAKAFFNNIAMRMREKFLTLEAK
jgi:hypothetical protein